MILVLERSGALDLHDTMITSYSADDWARRESGLGVAAWILWLRDEYGSFESLLRWTC